MRTFLYILALLSGSFVSISPVYCASLVFGVVPYKKPSELYVIYRPLIEHIAKSTGRDVDFIVGRSNFDIIEKYKTKQIDFGYLDPVTYVRAHRAAGVLPMLSVTATNDDYLHSVIVVREASPVRNLSQLKGQRFAFGDKNSTLSHYVPHYMLLMASLELSDLKNYQFLGGNDENIALNIINDNFDAGGISRFTAKNYLAKGLRIVAESPEMPSGLFVSRNNMSKSDQVKVIAALNTANLKLLQSIIPEASARIEKSDRDYDWVRSIVNVVDYSGHDR